MTKQRNGVGALMISPLPLELDLARKPTLAPARSHLARGLRSPAALDRQTDRETARRGPDAQERRYRGHDVAEVRERARSDVDHVARGEDGVGDMADDDV